MIKIKVFIENTNDGTTHEFERTISTQMTSLHISAYADVIGHQIDECKRDAFDKLTTTLIVE